MKKICLLFSLLLTVFLCIGALAVTDDATLLWSEPAATPNYTRANGYPRFAQLADGTLIMTTDSGYVSHSTDKGLTWTRAAQKVIVNAAATKTTATQTHKLSRANFQPFVLPDGTVLLAYRSHTSGYAGNGNEFYTSIRVMTSTDGGRTYENEQILVEDVAQREDGFWEPFMIMLDDDTVAMYYADDLNVDSHAKQRIAFLIYKISTGEWDTEPRVAINRPSMSTRDGMPTVTALKDGGFAMVTESQDYASWIGSNKLLGIKCTFIVGLSLSADGYTWSDPVPVFAPKDLTAGELCAAPSIATLPDGRVVITCQTDSAYSGYTVSSDTYMRGMGVMISNAPLTVDTKLTKTTGGAAEGFTQVEGVIPHEENRFQIWNTVSCFGNDLYLAGTSSLNAADSTRSGACIRLRHATVFADAGETAAYRDLCTRTESFAVRCGTPENGTLTLSVPATLSGELLVYRMKNGILTQMHASTSDNAITVSTEDAGFYALVTEPLFLLGDTTGEGMHALVDVLRLLRYLSDTQIPIDLSAADLDKSATLEIKDALLLLQYIID